MAGVASEMGKNRNNHTEKGQAFWLFTSPV